MSSITVQGADAVRRNLALIGKKSASVISRSINEGLKRARTDADRRIRGELAIKQKDVFASLKITASTRSSLRGTLGAKKKGRPLVKYSHTMLKKGGFTVKVKKAGPRIKFPTGVKVPAAVMKYSQIAFLAQPLVQAQGRRRLEWLYGPSVSQAWGITRDDALRGYADFTLRRLDYFLGLELAKLNG